MNTKSTVQKLNAPKELKKIFEKRPLFLLRKKTAHMLYSFVVSIRNNDYEKHPMGV
ncbi:hypothetical protein D3C87_1917760 [compost metagenome]|uniref:Uncharacterized protein n=1 Tax=Solitalea canadensis (strain ATCC 29591 / DSM 3403 / JCM 21819 / LMG 8368 / NBRC 15130 / NCIMB 12057 / USAM 9D) TaxID=929556 RepID=H8KLI9_SOLCM|nr:hypothetical protein Solca_3879 [Solitalea canadensis DSM 3403]